MRVRDRVRVRVRDTVKVRVRGALRCTLDASSFMRGRFLFLLGLWGEGASGVKLSFTERPALAQISIKALVNLLGHQNKERCAAAFSHKAVWSALSSHSISLSDENSSR